MPNLAATWHATLAFILESTANSERRDERGILCEDRLQTYPQISYEMLTVITQFKFNGTDANLWTGIDRFYRESIQK